MKDIWHRTLDVEDMKSTIAIAMTIKKLMYREARDDFNIVRTVAENDDPENAFEAGFMGGVVATIAYLKEGGDPHDGE